MGFRHMRVWAVAGIASALPKAVSTLSISYYLPSSLCSHDLPQ
jgi:hypothetical protein